MIPVLTADEAAALDATARSRGVPASTLMERAGHATARAGMFLAGGRYGRRVVIACGRGNNGGDGYVAARLLRSWGLTVTVHAVGGAPSREPAASARAAAEAVGVEVVTFGPASFARDLARADAAIDAVVGIGFRGPARGEPAEAIRAFGDARCPVLAVDVPSGLDATIGAANGPVVRADATVTFGAMKVGLVVAPEPCGPIEIADIGFPPELVRSSMSIVEAGDVAARLPRRAADEHKRSSGIVLVVAGSLRMPGAAAMAARAAIAAGAGLVRVAIPEPILPIVARLVPEATFLPLPATASGGIAAPGLASDDLADADALVVGPGLGRDDATAAWVRDLVDRLAVPAILDADGLNAFVGAPLKAGGGGLILTPHAGELARLAAPGDPAPDRDRIGAARALAGRTDAAVLLKGPATVVAQPDGTVRLNPTGGPALATAGTGDVLAGVIGAFLARGVEPSDAASAAAYVHGLAGDRVGELLGDGGSADDVIRALPAAIAGVRG